MGKISIDKALLVAKSQIKSGNLGEAQKVYEEILRVFPKNKRAQQGLASLLSLQKSINNLIEIYQRGQLSETYSLAKSLSKTFPHSTTVWNLLGAASKALDNNSEAVLAFRKVTELNAQDPDGFVNYGITLQGQGQHGEAIEAYKKALSLRGDYAEAYFNMGNALKDQGNSIGSVQAYSRAISIKPNYAEAYNNLGISLSNQRMLKDAIEAYNAALSIKPDYAEAYNNMGIALIDEKKLEDAVLFFHKAIALKPDYAEAHNNLGIALREKGLYDNALQTLKKAVSLRPNYADAYYNIGWTFKHYGDESAAIDAFKNALFCKADYEAARADKIYLQSLICDWTDVEHDHDLIPNLGTRESLVSPFIMFSLEDAPDRHRRRSEIYAKARFLQNVTHLNPSSKPNKKRIRIGYFSSDFQEHPVAYLIARVLELHNRDQFEVYGYSINGTSDDKIRKRLVNAFDMFRDVKELSDSNIALLARKDEIDIAIDLNGFTHNARPEIFAHRAALTQINFLGYPGTMGANFIDYMIVDQITVPLESQAHFSENLIFMPHTYLPTDNTRQISNHVMTRAQFGLPENGFVFCCFNNTFKITSSEYAIWMRALSEVEGSVLWLRRVNAIAQTNLIQEAQKRGINPARIIFADRMPIDEHLARYRLADLFIDTFNFNAHTTATEALWASLPVVTKLGKGFAARVAGSLLTAAGLPELVTTNELEYERLIIELAKNKKKLRKIREKLMSNRLSQPLFNTEAYTKYLEDSYLQVYQHSLSEKKPQTIIISK